jgi:hypothetical protein
MLFIVAIAVPEGATVFDEAWQGSSTGTAALPGLRRTSGSGFSREEDGAVSGTGYAGVRG